MAEYLHGAYGQINTASAEVAAASRGAFVYVGTAPVHTVEGGASNVNKPIVVNNIAEARKYLGYSDDWASYTLCEAMHAHLELNAVGPIILINVLNPKTNRKATATTASLTPVNGRITITNAEKVILDTLKIGSLKKGTDYSVSYNIDKQTITVKELVAGKLGTAALSVSYNEIVASDVTAQDVIGTTDGMGLNTGLYVINDVYTLTGYIPSFILAPGFSSDVSVHKAMASISQKINGHWDAYMLTDLPVLSGSTVLTLDKVAAYKKTNGFTCENETVYYPLATGTDGNTYHLSVLAAANLQTLLLAQDGIPFKSASNTPCEIIENLFISADHTNRVYDDKIINEYLCENGIASAAYVSGRWAIWGAHSADYDQDNADYINVAETSRMMLYYISNDFQQRRSADVDKPMTKNALDTIVSEEQARLDALLNIGALTYGTVSVDAASQALSDLMNGDYSFTFNVTTTPLAKSMTAIVNWTDDGFVTYFSAN